MEKVITTITLLAMALLLIVGTPKGVKHFLQSWDDYQTSSACVARLGALGHERSAIAIDGGTCLLRGEL